MLKNKRQRIWRPAHLSQYMYIHLKDSEDMPVEESHAGFEGNNAGFEEVRVRGDAISICSLDYVQDPGL